MNKLKFSNTEKGLIALLVVVMITFFFDRMAAGPSALRYRAVRGNNTSLKKDIEKYSGKQDDTAAIKALDEAKQSLSSVEEKLRNSKFAKVTTDKQLTDMQAELSRKAEARGLKVVSLSGGQKLGAAAEASSAGGSRRRQPQPAQASAAGVKYDFFEWQQFSLHLEGNYMDVLSFVRDLGGLPNAVVVHNIKIITNPEYGVVNVELTLLF